MEVFPHPDWITEVDDASHYRLHIPQILKLKFELVLKVVIELVLVSHVSSEELTGITGLKEGFPTAVQASSNRVASATVDQLSKLNSGVSACLRRHLDLEFTHIRVELLFNFTLIDNSQYFESLGELVVFLAGGARVNVVVRQGLVVALCVLARAVCGRVPERKAICAVGKRVVTHALPIVGIVIQLLHYILGDLFLLGPSIAKPRLLVGYTRHFSA